ncbi:MAG: MBOAT family protein [Clostridia bacterium]|nr:MBOAT family protein [Clostridia bacterium]
MVFSSLVFLCVFLPAVFLLYTIVPSIKFRNGLLIIASLLFYSYGEPVYVLLMIFSSIINYLCALFVSSKKQNRKWVLVLAVVINLGVLVVFKYSAFFVEVINSVTGLSLPVPQIDLPIGISFFTFQALSYVIDVYRKTVNPQKNYFYVLLYISFFPQLIAGPIVKYKDINEQITAREQNVFKIAEGLRRFIFGLSKKVLIANTMAQTADIIFSSGTEYMSVLTAWLGAFAYLFQIYYDFSGYSDMAIGLGKMFGFDFKENFNYPYGAISVRDFWRKWHISLSEWFKEYLYIPLGGNRKGKARTVRNRLIVFLFTGLWHGANWTFILWGIYHGIFVVLEELIPKLGRLPKVINHIYTMLVVIIGFVIFRADTVNQAFDFIVNMFGGFNISQQSVSFALSQLTPWFIVMFVAAIIGSAPLKVFSEKFIFNGSVMAKHQNVVQTVIYAISFVLLLWCIIRLSGNSYNPFIYFRF